MTMFAGDDGNLLGTSRGRNPTDNDCRMSVNMDTGRAPKAGETQDHMEKDSGEGEGKSRMEIME